MAKVSQLNEVKPTTTALNIAEERLSTSQSRRTLRLSKARLDSLLTQQIKQDLVLGTMDR